MRDERKDEERGRHRLLVELTLLLGVIAGAPQHWPLLAPRSHHRNGRARERGTQLGSLGGQRLFGQPLDALAR
eukprot:794291-Rhodomonas_salina.1